MGGVHVSGLQNTSSLAQQLSSSMTTLTTSPCLVVGCVIGGHFSGIQGGLVTETEMREIVRNSTFW